MTLRVDTTITEPGARDRIVRAATRLFARHGFEGTSLRMIAEAAGMQKGSLVYHFENKDKIREAVLDSLFSRWKAVLPQIMLAAASGDNRFQRVLDECSEFFLHEPDRARLLMRECLDHPEDLNRRLAGQVSPWLELVADTIKTGQRGGEIHTDLDPLAYIWLVVLMMLSTVAVSDMAPGLTGEADLGPNERLLGELTRIARVSLFTQPPQPREGV